MHFVFEFVVYRQMIPALFFGVAGSSASCLFLSRFRSLGVSIPGAAPLEGRPVRARLRASTHMATRRIAKAGWRRIAPRYPHCIVIGSEPRSRTRMEDFREEILARGHIHLSA
jgi:hypothetical protein